MPSSPQNWRTPRAIFDTLYADSPSYFGEALAFDLACDEDNRLLPAIAVNSDGTAVLDSLIYSWAGKCGFCNPPWKNVAAFVDKAIGENAKICMLLPVRTDQRWFRKLARAAMIEFFTGRVAFDDPLSLSRMAPREGCLVAWVGLNGHMSSDFRSNTTGARLCL